MPLTLPTKVARTARLLTSISTTPRAWEAMSGNGFDLADVAEGWDLVKAAATASMRLAGISGAAAPIADNTQLDRLNSWENLNYPIIEARLKHRFPDSHKRVFDGLAQTDGAALLVTVPLLIERIKREPDNVRQALAKVKIDDTRLADAEAIIKSIAGQPQETSPADTQLVDKSQLEREQRDAETAMWNFYLEWSAIAQQLITDKRVLRRLGYGSPGRPRNAEPKDIDTKDLAKSKTSEYDDESEGDEI